MSLSLSLSLFSLSLSSLNWNGKFTDAPHWDYQSDAGASSQLQLRTSYAKYSGSPKYKQWRIFRTVHPRSPAPDLSLTIGPAKTKDGTWPLTRP